MNRLHRRERPTRNASPSETDLLAFGDLLRNRREGASMNQEQLARRLGTSVPTLAQIERGVRSPSRAVLRRLCEVAELNLSPADLPSALDARRPQGPTRLSNALLTPQPLLMREAALRATGLRAARSVLRPVWAYLGPLSAHAFERFRARSRHTHALAAGLHALAAQLQPHLGRAPLEMVALGAGDGEHEVLLGQSLLEAGMPLRSLALVDLSEPLLASAYPKAVERLPGVEVWALLADLEELSVHADVLFVPKRQRLVLLLGGTFGELEDELRFLRHGLARCDDGDLLVLDVPCAAVGSAASIREHEGASAQRLLDQAREWLTTALAPHLPELPIEWTLRLETSGVVPGSYAWCALSRLVPPLRPCEIEMYRWRRYDPNRLTHCLGALGWDQVAACPYGQESNELHVYRRRAATGIPRRGWP